MPRLTLPRIACLFLVTIYSALILAFYLIPTPAYLGLERDAHINAVLQSGGTLTTVHDYDYTFEQRPTITFAADSVGIEDVVTQPQWSTHLAIDWQLKPCPVTNSVLLRIGDGVGPGAGVSSIADVDASSVAVVNLTELTTHAAPYLSTSVDVRVKAVNAASFSSALSSAQGIDDALLSHALQPRFDTVALRCLLTSPGTLQIWKDTPDWSRFSSLADLDDNDRAYGLLAKFTGIPPAYLEDGVERSQIASITATMEASGRIPSKNYPLRAAILKAWGPLLKVLVRTMEVLLSTVGFVVIGVLYVLLHVVPLYAVLVLVVWLAKGRPDFLPWSRRSGLTRGVYRFIARWSRNRSKTKKAKIWSLTGPVSDGKSEEGYDDGSDNESESDEELLLHQPTPLRTPADFFRSRSPLDDLLVTFESTRWMVEPMRSRGRNWRRGDTGTEMLDAEAGGSLSTTQQAKSSSSLAEKNKVRITL